MDWSGLDTGFLEGDRLPSENLITADSFFSLSSREPLLGEEHLGKPLLGEHLGETWQGSHFTCTDLPSPLPHSAASYRSTLLLKSCSSTLDICHRTSDSLEPDEADLETDYVDFEADDKANSAVDEVNFEEEEDVDLDISLYLASSSPRKNSIEESVQISDDQALGLSEFSDETAVTSDIGANDSTLEMPVQLFEEDTACNGLPIVSEQFLSIQEQLGIVQEKLMSSHLPF